MGAALKVPFKELAESKAKVRSAPSHATRKGSRNVATSSDDSFLYVWNEQRSVVGETSKLDALTEGSTKANIQGNMDKVRQF